MVFMFFIEGRELRSSGRREGHGRTAGAPGPVAGGCHGVQGSGEIPGLVVPRAHSVACAVGHPGFNFLRILGQNLKKILLICPLPLRVLNRDLRQILMIHPIFLPESTKNPDHPPTFYGNLGPNHAENPDDLSRFF